MKKLNNTVNKIITYKCEVCGKECGKGNKQWNN